MEEILEMSRKELERIKSLAQVIDGKITQLTAAKILKLSDRQVRNLLVELKTNGKTEGINNKIKTMKRQAYGFRDIEYLNLDFIIYIKIGTRYSDEPLFFVFLDNVF